MMNKQSPIPNAETRYSRSAVGDLVVDEVRSILDAMPTSLGLTGPLKHQIRTTSHTLITAAMNDSSKKGFGITRGELAKTRAFLANPTNKPDNARDSDIRCVIMAVDKLLLRKDWGLKPFGTFILPPELQERGAKNAAASRGTTTYRRGDTGVDPSTRGRR